MELLICLLLVGLYLATYLEPRNHRVVDQPSGVSELLFGVE